MPGAATLNRYRALGARIVTIDPGIDVVLARCKTERPWQMQQAVKEWYANAAGQEPEPVDTGTDSTRRW